MVRIIKKNGDVVWVNPNLVEIIKENYEDVSVRGDHHLFIGDTEITFDLKDNIKEIDRLSRITSNVSNHCHELYQIVRHVEHSGTRVPEL